MTPGGVRIKGPQGSTLLLDVATHLLEDLVLWHDVCHDSETEKGKFFERAKNPIQWDRWERDSREPGHPPIVLRALLGKYCPWFEPDSHHLKPDYYSSSRDRDGLWKNERASFIIQSAIVDSFRFMMNFIIWRDDLQYGNYICEYSQPAVREYFDCLGLKQAPAETMDAYRTVAIEENGYDEDDARINHETDRLLVSDTLQEFKSLPIFLPAIEDATYYLYHYHAACKTLAYHYPEEKKEREGQASEAWRKRLPLYYKAFYCATLNMERAANVEDKILINTATMIMNTNDCR